MNLNNLHMNFSSDIYRMAKYLILHDASESHCVESKIGKFMLGRGTGHTSAVLETADTLSIVGFNIRVIHLNEQMKNYAIKQSSEHTKRGNKRVPERHYTYNELLNNNIFRTDMSEHIDLFIFDAFTHAKNNSNDNKLEESIDEFVHYVFTKSNGTRTGFLFIQ